MRFVENEDGTREFFTNDSEYYAYIIEKSFCKSDLKFMFDLIQVLQKRHFKMLNEELKNHKDTIFNLTQILFLAGCRKSKHNSDLVLEFAEKVKGKTHIAFDDFLNKFKSK